MANTLPLSGSWDIQLDPAGNLVLTDPDASLAQDVASAIRTFLGECWYDVAMGLPYFQAILGQRPPASLVRSKIKQTAKRVAGVDTVDVSTLALSNRNLTGVIVLTRVGGTQPITVSF